MLCLCIALGFGVLQAQSPAERYLLAMAPVASVERAFVEASADALRALAGNEELVVLAGRHAAHASATVRLVVLEAQARGALGFAIYARALRSEDQASATWSLLHLEAAGLHGALLLFDVACEPRGPWHVAALHSLQRLRGAQRRTLLAALLARPLSALHTAVLAELAGLPAGAAIEDLLPNLYADPQLLLLLPAAARSSGDALRALLPPTTLLLDAPALQAVLAAPLPAHVLFLLETAPTLSVAQRVPVARALALLAHPSAAAMLTEALALGADTDRVAAFHAVMESRAQVPVQALLAGLVDASDVVRWAALQAAEQLQARLTLAEAAAVLPVVPADVADAFLDMVQRGESASGFDQVLLLVIDPAEGFEAPDLAAERLLRRPESSKHFAMLLRHPNELVRTLALASLVHRRWDEACFTAVEEAALANAPLARATAALALGASRSDRNRSLLLSLLRDAVPLVRECAALALMHQDNWHVVPALRALLEDADSSVRNAAACVLLRHGFNDVRPLLEADLNRVWLQARSGAALAAADQRKPVQ